VGPAWPGAQYLHRHHRPRRESPVSADRKRSSDGLLLVQPSKRVLVYQGTQQSFKAPHWMRLSNTTELRVGRVDDGHWAPSTLIGIAQRLKRFRREIRHLEHEAAKRGVARATVVEDVTPFRNATSPDVSVDSASSHSREPAGAGVADPRDPTPADQPRADSGARRQRRPRVAVDRGPSDGVASRAAIPPNTPKGRGGGATRERRSPNQRTKRPKRGQGG
jgi:hypothetical protein